VVIDDTLVRRLVASQFPQWADLSVRPLIPGGWDNRTFRLGETMLVRLPSAASYAAQVEKEHRWLPLLALQLPLSTPVPLAMGKSADGYPWNWSVYRWLEGATAAFERPVDLREFAIGLATFLVALQSIDPADGPQPGLHSFHRGGSLAIYDAEARRAIAALKDVIDVSAATAVWEASLATIWRGPPVWVHGDVSAGNLLVSEGRLSGVIDFGMLSVGDPACDLSIAWTFFGGESRQAFRATLPLADDAWARGRGWALWKALIVAAGFAKTNAVESAQAHRVIAELLADHARGLERA